MYDTFYDGHDELYHHAKFGEDRTTRAGCRWENVVCFLLLLTLRVRYLLTYRAFEGCIVRTSIALPFIARFRCGLQRFFHRWFLFQKHYIVLIFFARWRRNFHEIAVKNCEKSQNRRKSLCAPLRIDSWSIWKKIPLQQFRGEYVDLHLYKNFCARRYVALTACVKVRIGSPLQNGSEWTSLCAPKVLQEVNFPKSFWAVVCWMDCSCAPMFRFFSVASDGATTEHQI